jgi:hypothetical protein
MRRFLKHFPFNKLFVSLFVILYTFVPSTEAMRVVAEDISSEIDTSEDILDEGISDPPEIANPNVSEEEVIQEVVPEATEPLFTYVDGVYTVNKVVVNEEYVYPDNSNVRVKFTNVSEEGNLVIKRVELTQEEKELLNTSDDYGWDISSNMINGSFKYDLTLPNSTESNDVEVKYTEDGNTYESIDNNLIVNENVIEIKGLEHFTVFVVVDADTYLTPAEQNSACGAIYTSYGGCYTSIQDAINAATDGATIYIGEGTYEVGQVLINKNLTIQGVNNKETTIIKPSQNTSNSGDARGWFLVNSGKEFNLSNVTLDGSGFNIYQAIRSYGSGTI